MILTVVLVRTQETIQISLSEDTYDLNCVSCMSEPRRQIKSNESMRNEDRKPCDPVTLC